MFITLIFTGCSKVSENNALNDAKDKLESHNYEAAIIILSQIIDEDSNNEEARSMYMQARKMSSAERYESNNDFERAIKELEDIVDINNGSQLIKKEAVNKKSELEKLQEEKEKDFQQKKYNAKESSKEHIKKSEYEIINNYKEEQEKNEEATNEEVDSNEENNTVKPEEKPSQDTNLEQNNMNQSDNIQKD